MPRILIRCDIGSIHGLGHATRCKALAQVLAARGADVGFMSETPALEAFVAPFPCVDARQPDYLELDVLVIDTKAALDEAWYTRFAGAMGCRTVRIDHPQATPDTCDILVAPLAHWAPDIVQRLQRDFGEHFLYGWEYVMLPEDVTDGAPLSYDEREPQIVFCAGGSDPDGALQQMYDWTTNLEIDAELCFLIGAYVEYDRLAMKYMSRKNVPLVAPFTRAHLAETSLVVTTFGQTMYEALWYQTPCIVLARNDDDDCHTLWLQQQCAAVYAVGDIRAYTNRPEQFCRAIQVAWTSRTRSAALAAEKLDGRGVARIADAILRLC